MTRSLVEKMLGHFELEKARMRYGTLREKCGCFPLDLEIGYAGKFGTRISLIPEEIEMIIPVSFERLSQYYPRRPDLTPELKRFMASITGTPCCVQMSHCLNMAGQKITQTYVGQRRNNSLIRINGLDYYYLLAVDEMEKWLALKYGDGESVSLDDSGQKRTPDEIKRYLQGRTGILVMRDAGFGFHTELWDGQTFLQTDMNVNACLGQPRVFFWDCGPPQWLTDYMSGQG